MVKKYSLIHLFVLFMCFISIGCSSQDQNKFSGYVEGDFTYVATGVSGTLQKLNVRRGETVKKDDLLFQLDPEPDQAAMGEAKANVEKAQAEVALAKIQYSRYEQLYAKNATDHATLDQKRTDLDTKSKALLAAQQNFTAATWAFNQKTVYSPTNGMVFDTYYRLGEKVTPNSPVVAVLAASNINVIFFIPEAQLSRIHLNQEIQIDCDGCKEKTKASIYYISPEAEYTPPIIYHQDTRYKLVYRVKASLPLSIALTFHPGQPLDIYLHE